MASASQARRKAVGGFAPLLEIAVADAEVEVCGAMLRIDFGELRIGARGGLVIVHLILDVAQRGVQARIPFAVFDRLGEQAGGAFELALQVQGHRLGERLVGALLVLEIGDGVTPGGIGIPLVWLPLTYSMVHFSRF